MILRILILGLFWNVVFANDVVISMTATVPEVCVLSNSMNAEVELIGVKGSNDVGILIAEISEKCNGAEGHGLAFSSANGGYLKSEDGDVIQYLLSYVGCIDGKRTYSALHWGCARSPGDKKGVPTDLKVHIHRDKFTTSKAGVYKDTITVTVKSRS